MAFFSSVILIILIIQYEKCLVLVHFPSLVKEMYGEMIFLKVLLITNYHLQVHILSLEQGQISKNAVKCVLDELLNSDLHMLYPILHVIWNF